MYTYIIYIYTSSYVPSVYHHIDTDYDVYNGYNHLQSQHMFGTYLVMVQNPGTLGTLK